MEDRKKIAVVALSGGVDSSVSALLLQQQGYEVIGVTGKMVNTEHAQLICENARLVADKLGIKHVVLDLTQKFRSEVVDYFKKSYQEGKTPNPCIKCNQFIKWGDIFDYAVNILKADVYATGHYAKIKLDNGIYKLYPADDEHKDQLYFLYRLKQHHLAKTVFPLSEFKKDEVRQLAYDYDLPPKSSKESQDICFIHRPLTTKKYLIDKLGEKKGDFVDILTGKKWGEHSGCYQYTIGQRKGIGIAAPYPLYVIDIDANKNIVYLGREQDNYKSNLKISDLNFVYPPAKKEFDAFVKIRYNMQHKKARICICGDCADVQFYEPVNSITQGQACVIYDMVDLHLIGGGWICR